MVDRNDNQDDERPANSGIAPRAGGLLLFFLQYLSVVAALFTISELYGVTTTTAHTRSALTALGTEAPTILLQNLTSSTF
jgi:hypothetical protein